MFAQRTRHLINVLFINLEVRKMSNSSKILCLFDVDGTLTPSRKTITPDFENFIVNDLAPRSNISIVGGSDFQKISEQIGTCLNKFHTVFSENGLVVHRSGVEVKRASIQNHIGEEKLQMFINFALRYMSEITLPVKRGTFVEFRSGLINVCPVGRSCTQEERDQFDLYDQKHKIREKFVEALKNQFPDLGLTYAIGGQISIDVYPIGWDKTYCLNHIPEEDYAEIHFFGDKTEPGGNDHELFKHPRVIGHSVKNPEDTKLQLIKLLNL